MSVSQAVKAECLQMIEILLGKQVKLRVVQRPSITIITDASLSGYGGVLISANTFSTYAGCWALQYHINILEMFAVEKMLKRFARRHNSISILSDNTTVINILRRGHSSTAVLNNAVIRIYQWVLERDISFQISYVPKWMNPADAMSRGLPSSSWPQAAHGLLEEFAVGLVE